MIVNANSFLLLKEKVTHPIIFGRSYRLERWMEKRSLYNFTRVTFCTQSRAAREQFVCVQWLGSYVLVSNEIIFSIYWKDLHGQFVGWTKLQQVMLTKIYRRVENGNLLLKLVTIALDSDKIIWANNVEQRNSELNNWCPSLCSRCSLKILVNNFLALPLYTFPRPNTPCFDN